MPEEQRGHRILHHYWESLKDGRSYPCESRIDSDMIADIWPSCFLISIDDVTRRLGYRYSYLGTQLIEAFGDEGNPDVALELLATADKPLVKMFDQVRATFAPSTGEAEFVNAKQLIVKYRTTLLPLGYDDRNVSHIIGYMGWKVA